MHIELMSDAGPVRHAVYPRSITADRVVLRSQFLPKIELTVDRAFLAELLAAMDEKAQQVVTSREDMHRWRNGLAGLKPPAQAGDSLVAQLSGLARDWNPDAEGIDAV